MSDQQPRPASRMNEEKKFPRGAVIRIFVYFVATHIFAAFLFLLFKLGGAE
ncbi:hypothetical protein GCM10010420_15890 [Streptomyces glaucosporus]|uniref:Small hydrophobic protein n=1 Tax=Streptomyces glaucosporus TaxID=284044 RepID=A0ABN3I0Q6_9ACTN